MRAKPSLDEIFAQQPVQVAEMPGSQADLQAQSELDVTPNIGSTSKRPSLDEIFAQPEAKPQGFIDKFISTQRQRGAEDANLDAMVEQGQYSKPVAQYHKLGQVGAGVNDLIGQGISSTYNTLMTDAGKQRVNDDLQKLAQTKIGQAGIEALKQGGEIWDTYKQANPRTADIIASTANIGGAALGLGGIAKSAPLLSDAASAGAAEVKGLASPLVNAGKDATQDIASNVKSSLMPSKEPLPNSDDIKAQASQSYKLAADKGGVLKPELTNGFLDEIESIKPKPIAGKLITSEDKKIIDSVEEFKALKDTPLTLEDVQRLDEALGKKIDSFVDPKSGVPNKDGLKIMALQDKLRDTVENAPEDMVVGGKEGFNALKDARAQWSTALRIRDMERILDRAKDMDNEATSIKAGFKMLKNNPSRFGKYNKAEQEAIRQAARSGIVGGALRTVLGSRLLGTMVGTAAGTATGGAFGAAVGAGIGAAQSSAARAAAASMQTKRANNAIREVAKRLPKDVGKLPPREAQKILNAGKK